MGEGASTGGGAGLAIFLVCWLGLSLLMLVSMWVVLKKAGQPGWAILVPIYNVYVMLKVAGMPAWWLLLMFLPIINAIASIMMVLGIAKNFGKGAGFAVGLLFLPFIFYPVLAFGDAQYGAA